MDDLTDRAKTEVAAETYLRDGTAGRDYARKLPDQKARPKARLWPLVLLGVAVLLGFGLYRIATAFRAPRGESPVEQLNAPQPVGIATIGTGDIKVIVTGLGAVTPLATVTVRTQVNGQLLEVGFEEGQLVKKGDFLAQIDPRPFQLAEVQYEGQLIHDQGLLEQAKMDLARYQALVKQNSIARQQAEDQEYIVKQYEGSVKLDQAQIDNQKLNLIYARIVSPIDGRVGLRLVDAGNYVQTTDANGLAVLTQLHPITVIFVVPEDDIQEIMAGIKAGTPLEVTAYDRANVTPLSVGKVETIDNQIDPTTGTVKIRAIFDNLDDKLFPNQFVNARLLLKSLHGVMTVPSSAVQRGAPGTYVYVVGADDKVSARPVKLGPLDGAMYAVDSGLSLGERVVVDGTDRLRDGARVLVSTAEGGSDGKPAQSGGHENAKGRSGNHHHSDHSGGEPTRP
ncbi:MAG TPA: MdtA/MuxA family multidrug efflux RND transporter periplasmic adaptor subunit [Methylocella sp.]|nr:MdtA/MuxA family multidrug efflux RND transporter periplasmic adaptor subunit [Methylocella sp.]